MYEHVDIPLSDLLLDAENPRLAETQPSQQEVAIELARQQGDNILRLAADIVENGLDPTARTAVVATGDRRKRYRVLEGNRRVLALRALETPSFIAPALTTSNSRRLTELARKFEDDPIESVPCVLFESEDEAQHWIKLRHTGQNLGVGLVEWGRDERERYEERHAGTRTPARQVVDFVEKHGTLSQGARDSRQKILTSVERMLETSDARERFGVDVRNKQVLALFPADEVARSLTHFVEDLKMARVRVPDLYHVEDRRRYVASLPKAVLPKKSRKLAESVALDDLTAGRAATPAPAAPRRPRPKAKATRTTVIPKNAKLDVTNPRINRIFNELLSLNAEQFPNACSVLLRVFIELSLDHYIADKKLMADDALRSAPLAKKLKSVVKSLEDAGRIPSKLARAIEGVADGNRHVLAAPIVTFHQYVHNEYVYPRATDLYVTWDEISPFMEKVWP